MASRNEVTLPATRPKSRRSLSHTPTLDGMDKENMTTDIGSLGGSSKRSILGDAATKKKSRSKSLGPGGLDALRDGTGNRRQSIAAPLPRSILKPTIAPVQAIAIGTASQLINKSKATAMNDATPPTSSSSSVGANPAVAETRVMLRTEEQQQAAAREREEKEQVEHQNDERARREARRKSLANRRVSFAPEATLHTWDVVEYLQDSTTSSNATNSTRRASSMSEASVSSPGHTGHFSSDPSEPPSTPPEQIEDETVQSPAHQRDLHQQKRRRSSGIPPLNFNNPDDEDFSSSPSSTGSAGDDGTLGQGFVADEDDNSSDSNSDDDGETAMSLDMGEATDMSMASVRSTASSTGSSARLEAALQLAAQQAGTQGIDFDEHAVEEEEAVISFKPWSKKSDVQILSPLQDQENVDPFSFDLHRVGPKTNTTDQEEDDGMTMEMTRAVGGILPAVQAEDDGTMEMTMDMTMDMTVAAGRILTAAPEASKSRRKSVAPTRRQSTRRRSSADSSMGDDTMDLTMAIGGIQQDVTHDEDQTGELGEEDMSMELTSVLGGVLAPASGTNASRRQSVARRQSVQNRRRRSSMRPVEEEQTMEITRAVGSIMSVASTSRPAYEPTVQVDMDMDMTVALGGILPSQEPAAPTFTTLSPPKPAQSEVGLAKSPSSQTPNFRDAHTRVQATVASETGSPSLAAFRGQGLRRSGAGARVSTTPKAAPKSPAVVTPATKLSSPAKPASARSAHATPTRASATKRTPTNNVVSTPNNAWSTPTPKTASAKKTATRTPLFRKDNVTGVTIPGIILTPKSRRSSGVGADRVGLGSPHIAALLDRRTSIGNQALAFTSEVLAGSPRGVRFEDPKLIEEELDKERQEEIDREDGRTIMEREADNAEPDRDATVNLKEMIQSLTPKKNPLKGRKSLAPTAKGILGKRPAELDEDEQEAEDEGGVKRLKNHQGSPVKNVKLAAPPSKAETTGRMTRAARRSLELTSGNIVTPTTTASPVKGAAATTPKGRGRFQDPAEEPAAVPFVEKLPVEEPLVEEGDSVEEKMHLQEFLNLTSIRFMELTTTKRRHTMATKNEGRTSQSTEPDTSLENCVVAGACTVPMLELFQHSCRELKKYISEGRNILREIETETFEENPPLFREYLSATADMRVLMDNQFKNVKTHSRLLSKAMWYEWRMKLLEGLRDGLQRIDQGMAEDDEVLRSQQELLDTILPELVKKHELLVDEHADLASAAEELANCDQEELNDARQKLVSTEADIEIKTRLIKELQDELQEKQSSIDAATERKQRCQEDIEDANKIREACRGWTAEEGMALKAKVDALEKKYGWAITGVTGTQLSMTYRRDIELVFDASSFMSNGSVAPVKARENTRIDLWYIAANRELNPSPLTHEKDFFLQNIRDYCRSLPQAQTTVKKLLDVVSASWTTSLQVVNNIRSLNRHYPTDVSRTSDSSILVTSTLLLAPLASKVKVQLGVNAQHSEQGLAVQLTPQVNVVYGERFNEPKMSEFLVNRTALTGAEEKAWGGIVLELEEKLLARGRK